MTRTKHGFNPFSSASSALPDFHYGHTTGWDLNGNDAIVGFDRSVTDQFSGALDLIANRYRHVSATIDLRHSLLRLKHTVVIQHRHNPTIRRTINQILNITSHLQRHSIVN